MSPFSTPHVVRDGMCVLRWQYISPAPMAVQPQEPANPIGWIKQAASTFPSPRASSSLSTEHVSEKAAPVMNSRCDAMSII